MTSNSHFLIVDDDSVFCRILARGLAARGHEAAIAHNSQQAIAACKQLAPTHIVLDLRLGDESGLGLIADLKELTPTAEILLLTGYASIPSAVEAVKRGAANYIQKPATVDEILAGFGPATCLPSTGESAGAALPSVRRVEWEHIQRVLSDNDGNVSETARQLGMHRRSLQRKLAKRPVIR
ncbi:MAG: two-component system response regulator RegA [Gammaproteobacteria bacterium]|jgi:two-component system response regulator RegA